MIVRVNVHFYAVVLSKLMFCKFFYVRSNLRLIGFEYFCGKTLHVEGNKIPTDVPADTLDFSTLVLYVRCLELVLTVLHFLLWAE